MTTNIIGPLPRDWTVIPGRIRFSAGALAASGPGPVTGFGIS